MDKNKRIRELVKALTEIYSKYSFEDHCYRRMAYDNVIGDKWDRVVKKPFNANTSPEVLDKVIDMLDEFITDEEFMLECNRKSLEYRNK